ncbi:MAG: HD domain-containing protein [Thermoflexales bacterium]
METKGPVPRSLFTAGAFGPVLDAYVQINQLKQLYRQGWLRRGVPRERCESVAEHTAGVAWLTLLLAPNAEGLDADRALRMALIHDLGETHAGDITPADGVSETDKHARERQALHEIVAGLSHAADWLALWEEYASGQSPEARFVHEVDRLEMGLQAVIYRAEGLVDPTEFIASVRSAVVSPALRTVLEELLEQARIG